MPAFQRFGGSHLAVLAATAVLAVLLSVAVRRGGTRFRLSVRLALAIVLLGSTALFLVLAARAGELRWWDFVPLQLCDMAIFLAAYALLALRRWAAELLYFWAGAGTLIAMIGPDLGRDFPSWDFIFFFGLHAAVVVSAAVLTFGLDLRPRPRATWRALALTNVYAAGVALVNLATGANFMYLRAKPQQASVLDHLGPWPVYILGGEALALVLFLALEKAAAVRYSAPSQTEVASAEEPPP
jgi:hypothetical integral membrane protein (TIGR02206 family)